MTYFDPLMASGSSLHSALLSRHTSLDSCASLLERLVHPVLYRNLKTSCVSSGVSPHYHGAIFNIEFSPTDSVVLAACSNNSLVGYDPRITTTKPVLSVPNAHSNCTNCITFIDDKTFATCSDDKTIRLWDLRDLSSCVCTLLGHTNWIKNIEYDWRSNKIFSVAFNDGVREWMLADLKSGNYEDANNLVFELGDPVRMRIAPDGSKMFVSLRQNKCFLIDRFDGNTIAKQNKTIQELVSDKGKAKASRYNDLCELKTNRPSLFVMSGLRGTQSSYRSVMSVTFHPSSQMVALRHIDVKGNHLEQELSTLYDLRASGSDYQPLHSIEQSSANYLKYTDEYSPGPSLDYIKECHFSPNGQVLASPYENGVRLLAVDSECTPVEVYYDDRYFSAKRTAGCCDFEVVNILTGGHSNPVLACRFAHHDTILATGCMDGLIRFHKPKL